MARFLLLHGSWHGAWCWFKVAPLLRKETEVVVPDLPARTNNQAFKPVVSLGRMVRFAANFLDPNVRTTIVAHSRYGIVASMLAERYPERIRRVIYLASYMLAPGQNALDAFTSDRDSYLQPFVQVNRLGAWDWLDPQAYREGLYADCSEEDVVLASSLLCREPSLPALARLPLTERSQLVPRAYIRLSRDRAVTPSLQDRLISRWPPGRVETLHASHSAYFSMPEKLSEILLKLHGD